MGAPASKQTQQKSKQQQPDVSSCFYESIPWSAIKNKITQQWLSKPFCIVFLCLAGGKGKHQLSLVRLLIVN